MELANASLYDGATSVAEAISVAINKTKRDNVVISSGFNPNTKEVVNTLIDNNKFISLRLVFLGKGESFSYVQILDNPGNLGLCYAAPYSYPEQVRLQRIRQNYLGMIFI